MKWRPILGIAVKDLKHTFRDKMTIFWTLVFPLMFITLSAVLWTPKEGGNPITLDTVIFSEEGFMEDIGPGLVKRVMEMVNVSGEPLFKIRVLNSSEDVVSAVRDGKADVGLVFPRGFAANMTRGFPATLKVYIAGGDVNKKQVIQGVVGGFLMAFNENISMFRINTAIRYYIGNVSEEEAEFIKKSMEGIAKPIQYVVEEVVPETLATREKIIGWYTIGMIGVQFMFSGMIGASAAIIAEKEKGTLARFLSAPISPWEVLLGKTLAEIVSLIISAAVCIVYGVLALNADIAFNPLNPAHMLSAFILFLGGIMMIGCGLIISIFAKTVRGSSGIATVITWPLMFLTGLVIPEFLLPESLRFLARIFPLTKAINAVRDAVVFGAGVQEILPSLPPVLAGAVVAYTIGVIGYRRLVKQAV